LKVVKKQVEILPVMVGTAGHVDHGKTALVKHLTGCDTDRLREEKERGLTIDLGFAPCYLNDGSVVGIVDVPGHEDFIRNMVAGAACIDVLMLVIAADDGVMPQTDEHLKIVKLLRTPRVFVALTKIDLVDEDHLAIVREDIASFLGRNGFPDAPVIACSSKTFDGLNDVREQLHAVVDGIKRVPDPRAFRMNIERSFSIQGYGTVATGVPASGRAAIGDKLEILPEGKATAVRALQSYKLDAESAPAGACAALNLRDLEVSDVVRGGTVAARGIYRATDSALLYVENVSETMKLKRREQVRFHSGTAAVGARTRLLEGDELLPGRAGFVQVMLAEPLVLAAGDRFVIRSLTPVGTLAGGQVLSARGARIKRSEAGLSERLAAARDAAISGDYLLSELLAGPGAVLDRAELLRLTQLPLPEAEKAVAVAADSGDVEDLGAGGWLVSARASGLAAEIAGALSRYHAKNKYAWGMEPGNVCRQIGLPAGCFEKLKRHLTANGDVVMRHGYLARADWEPALSAQQMQLRGKLLARLESAGSNAPARGDLVAEMAVSESDMRLVLRLLAEEGLASVFKSNIILTSVVDQCREKLLELFGKAEVVGISEFRGAAGLSRNLAVAILESFDAEKLTRRCEGGRKLMASEGSGDSR
jgi:selenocysteine-specific elongation factor